MFGCSKALVIKSFYFNLYLTEVGDSAYIRFRNTYDTFHAVCFEYFSYRVTDGKLESDFCLKSPDYTVHWSSHARS